MKSFIWLSVALLILCTSASAQVGNNQACPNLSRIQYYRPGNLFTDANTSGETTRLQNFLKSYLSLNDQQFIVTGIFGKVTDSFVWKFQSQNNILPTGIVGRITMKKISDICNNNVQTNVSNTNVSNNGSNTNLDARFTINGGGSATVNVGDTVNYQWASANGQYATSSIVLDKPACGFSNVGPHAWSEGYGNSLNGSKSAIVDGCLEGRNVTIQYKVTNSQGQVITSTANLSVRGTSTGPDTIVISPASQTLSIPLNTTTAYSKMSATGSTGPYTWSVSSGTLPGGVSLNRDGSFSGTFTTVGTFAATIKATSANGSFATVSFTWIVTSSSEGDTSTSTSGAYLDFGGMFGYGLPANIYTKDNTVYVNPATGSSTCPTDYNVSKIFGSGYLDYPIYLCSKVATTGSVSAMEFGGMFGYGSSTNYVNPFTASMSCPTGFANYRILQSPNLDYPLFFCGKLNHNAKPSFTKFGGMFGYGLPANIYTKDTTIYVNPLTGSDTCPSGYKKSQALYTMGVDYPIYYCTK